MSSTLSDDRNGDDRNGDRDAIADILAFHLEAGADVALGEEPVDRFAESEAARRAAPAGTALPPPAGSDASRAAPSPSRPAPSRPAPAAPRAPAAEASPALAPPPPDVAASEAREAAASAPDLDALRALLESFEGCPLKHTATRLVFADGNPQARLMLVGEAPGRDEDIEGKPFVGRSGKLLDRMLAAIGIDRSSAYIANVVPWRPPGNRTPTPQEAAICLPFIRRQIALANPDVLVCLGGPSAQTLLGIREGITKARGRWLDYDTGSRVIPALATFHPAYLLRSPLGKRMAWRDLLAIEARLGGSEH
ncbi:uracil-DNA glycosylase [Ancylobacter dichloromethanicus]|uniref:Type-4 uracil-DNA glycosylase n=1 Tax=Ancylobacter dichloromethanicus TaxID=518825 RepID=A0A9W6JDW4_9HYPH|nr:uracil-DNA glycosylase [Ancylobacter dichloromethanicus]MBS7552462.1 uracil-DNA glycosylase [Ancylobacter dichloromethanicus]GLK74204.1 uracil-DNA glycosylase [Ancylobacter dichloromethanicus]